MFRITSQKEQINNLVGIMKSVNPSVYVPKSDEARLWEAITEVMRMYNGTKTGEVVRRIMQGEDPHNICEAMGIDKRELNMCLGYFHLDWQTAYYNKLPKKQRTAIRKLKGWR